MSSCADEHFLNASFGNAAQSMIALMALVRDSPRRQALITGLILGTSYLCSAWLMVDGSRCSVELNGGWPRLELVIVARSSCPPSFI